MVNQVRVFRVDASQKSQFSFFRRQLSLPKEGKRKKEDVHPNLRNKYSLTKLPHAPFSDLFEGIDLEGTAKMIFISGMRTHCVRLKHVSLACRTVAQKLDQHQLILGRGVQQMSSNVSTCCHGVFAVSLLVGL